MHNLQILLIGVMGLAIISSNVYAQQAGVLLSPLKQIQSGVLPQDVKCKANFVLIINSKNNLPACVKPTTEQRLLERGWITPEKFEANPIMKYNENKPQNIPIEKNTNNGTTHKPISFAESNSTVPITNTTGNLNSSINATYIYKMYDDFAVNGTVSPLLGPFDPRPLPELQVNYTVSSTEPDSIKILFIGMSPNPLKVGDIPQFTLTWQNISDKTIYENIYCTITPLGLAISPSDNVRIFPVANLRTCSVAHAGVYSGQIATNGAGIGTSNYDPYLLYAPGHYQIMKPSLLNMTMTLKLLKDAHDSWDLVEIIHFAVNVTS